MLYTSYGGHDVDQVNELTPLRDRKFTSDKFWVIQSIILHASIRIEDSANKGVKDYFGTHKSLLAFE